MLKVEQKPKILLIGVLMSEASLLQLDPLMLILVSPNTKTVGDGDTRPSHTESKCYDLKLKGLSNKTTLVLSNTRELNRVSSTK